MDNLNSCRHLNEEDKIHFSMDETAKGIYKLNFGDKRMLIAILKVREENEKKEGKTSELPHTCAWFTKKLRELLELGFY